MIVDRTKQAAERWSLKSKVKMYMASLEHYQSLVAREAQKNEAVESSYCSVTDDMVYVMDYENSDEMDSVIMMMMKEKVYYA
jgi:hypothetical protein